MPRTRVSHISACSVTIMPRVWLFAMLLAPAVAFQPAPRASVQRRLQLAEPLRIFGLFGDDEGKKRKEAAKEAAWKEQQAMLKRRRDANDRGEDLVYSPRNTPEGRAAARGERRVVLEGAGEWLDVPEEEAPKVEVPPEVVAEAPTVVEEAPTVVEEEAPKVVAEAPKVVDEAPASAPAFPELEAATTREELEAARAALVAELEAARAAATQS